MAEVIAGRRWPAAGIEVDLRSAGLAAAVGQPASEGAREVVARHGGDLGHHRSRSVQIEDLRWADLVLTMTVRHREVLRSLKVDTVEIATLAGFGEGIEGDVPDPYGGTLEDYEEAYRQIEKFIGGAEAELIRRRDSRETGIHSREEGEEDE